MQSSTSNQQNHRIEHHNVQKLHSLSQNLQVKLQLKDRQRTEKHPKVGAPQSLGRLVRIPRL